MGQYLRKLRETRVEFEYNVQVSNFYLSASNNSELKALGSISCELKALPRIPVNLALSTVLVLMLLY